MSSHLEPLVSVVIPLYNAQEYIAETIESVISQTFTNWELLVIDDCSTDNSVNFVKQFEGQDQRIKLIELSDNFGGPAGPRNVGVKEAKGEYIAFLDADDIWVKSKLKYQINYMLSNNLNFSSTNLFRINESSKNIESQYKVSGLLNKIKGKSSLRDLIMGNFIATSSVVLKKDRLLDFNEDVNLIAVEDFYLWLEIFNQKGNRYGYINEKLLTYRVVSNSISERGTCKQEVKSNLCVLKFILKYEKWTYFKQYSIKVASMYIMGVFNIFKR